MPNPTMDRLQAALREQHASLLLTNRAYKTTLTFIRVGTDADATDGALVERLVSLINEAFLAGEKGLVVEPWQRTNAAEVKSFLREGGPHHPKLLLAMWMNEVVGCARVSAVQRQVHRVGEFGMLAVAPKVQRYGIGSKLAHAAEKFCAERGCSKIEIDLLTPRGWDHPHKDGVLRSWYGRLGYRQVLAKTEMLPKGTKPPCACPIELGVDCDYELHFKPLDRRAFLDETEEEEIMERFRQDGFVVVDSVFSAAEMAAAVKEAMRISDEDVAKTLEERESEGNGNPGEIAGGSNCPGSTVTKIKKLGYLVDVDPNDTTGTRVLPRKIDFPVSRSSLFQDLATHPRLEVLLRLVISAQATSASATSAFPSASAGPSAGAGAPPDPPLAPLLFADQAFMKPPHFGSAKPYHQDNFYFQCSPADDVITAWVALEDATVENGCLRYIRGSHTGGAIPHAPIPGDPNQSNLTPARADLDLANEVPAEVRMGGVILHHSNTLHCSRENRSSRWRRAYASHWVTSRVQSQNETLQKAHFKQPWFVAKSAT